MPGSASVRAVGLAAVLAVLTACGSGVDQGGGAPPAQSGPDRPNFVLLLADDMGWTDAGFMGHPRILTPHLDALAADGLVFDRFYAAAPACAPTRGSVLTGRHPSRYGIEGTSNPFLPREETTLAELLGREGYATGHFGKWNLGRFEPRGKHTRHSPPWSAGFEHCFSTEHNIPTWDPLVAPASEATRWWPPLEPGDDTRPSGAEFWIGEGRRYEGPVEGSSSRLVMDRTLEFVGEAVEAERAFVAVVWFYAPHSPFVSGPPHSDWYADLPLDQPERHYYGSISAMDAEIGRLRDALRELGVADDTLLWFSSDNGPAGVGQELPGTATGLRGRKSSLFEGGLRVPSVLAWPAGLQAGGRTDAPAVSSDILPTVLEAAGIMPPPRRPLDGESLLPLLRGQDWKRAAPIAFDFLDHHALTDERFKYMFVPGLIENEYFSTRSRLRPGTYLFDLEADPGEQVNLARERSELAEQMADAHAAWRRSCAASAAK